LRSGWGVSNTGQYCRVILGALMAKVTVSFTLNDQADRDVIAWIDRISDGQKSAAIREALRGHLRGGVSLDQIYQKLLEIDGKLTNGVMASTSAGAGDVSEPPDVAATLDKLGL